MLCSSSAIRLWLRRARRGTKGAQFNSRAGVWMGITCCRCHDEYRGSLCVPPSTSVPLAKIQAWSFLPYLDAYTNDSFPKYQGEISALQNLARVLGGFSVAYFQVPWATKHGALQTLGCEAA